MMQKIKKNMPAEYQQYLGGAGGAGGMGGMGGGWVARNRSPTPRETHEIGVSSALAERRVGPHPLVSLTDVAGRSSPRSVSVCQWPFSSSNSITVSGPGTFCSAAAFLRRL